MLFELVPGGFSDLIYSNKFKLEKIIGFQEKVENACSSTIYNLDVGIHM